MSGLSNPGGNRDIMGTGTGVFARGEVSLDQSKGTFSVSRLTVALTDRHRLTMAGFYQRKGIS